MTRNQNFTQGTPRIRRTTVSRTKRERLTSSILKKWRERNCWFVRFVNGDTLGCRRENLEWIHLADVLLHPEYTVDWDCGLTNQERALLEDESWVSGLRITRAETPTSQTSSQPASA